MSTLRFLFIGDVVGAPGRMLFEKHIARLKNKYKIDSVVVNGENSADRGRGISPGIVRFFKDNGADVITSGNHIWARRDIYSFLDSSTDLIRPANFPHGSPGVGIALYECGGAKVAIVNLQGRVFMHDHLECPFKKADSILTYLRDKTNIIFVDFHAEATSEKMGLAYYLDGRISGLVGTHTHVPTADARILPKGTGYITDLGMVGTLNSMLGMKSGAIIQRFITQMPTRFEVETEGPGVLSGVWIEVDRLTGHAVDIGQVRLVDEEFFFDGSSHE